LAEGVKTNAGGIVIIDTKTKNFKTIPNGFEKDNDGSILVVALAYRKKYRRNLVHVLTKDTILRVKANSCGLVAEDYQNDKIVSGREGLYSGLVG